MYELVTGKQLFAVGNSLSDYQAKLASINLMDLSGCPPQLVPTLKPMLSTQPAGRPNANAFAGAPYFQVRGQHMLHLWGLPGPRAWPSFSVSVS